MSQATTKKPIGLNGDKNVWWTHHQRLRDIRLHEWDCTKIIEDVDKGGILFSIDTNPRDVALWCEMMRAESPHEVEGTLPMVDSMPSMLI
jgi:hypothetical protein